MAMKLSLSIAAAFVAATLVGLSAIQPVDHPAGTATVDRMSREQAPAAPIVLAQYSRCWNGRCR